MSSRDQRARTAAETVAIVQAGTYVASSAATISIYDAVQMAVHQSVLITPGEFRSLRARAQKRMSERAFHTSFDVRNETTLGAARRLVAQYGADRVAALNFASAKNPAGGFLTGAQAQEESLARASALCACLQSQMDFYDANRAARSLLYTDHMIVSPQVPVFRDDDEQLLEHPWKLTIITSPAPNAKAIRKTQPESIESIEPTFRRRVEQVLSAAVVFDQTALVLGAWGCGVFGNSSATVARLFGEFLLCNGPFAMAFEQVTFAILDRHGQTIADFAAGFGNSTRIDSHPDRQ